MAISIDDFANKFSLNVGDVLDVLAKAGSPVEDPNGILSDAQMVILKQQANKKKRPTLSLNLGSKVAEVKSQEDVKVIDTKVNSSPKELNSPAKSEQKIGQEVVKNYRSDVDAIKSNLAVKESKSQVADTNKDQLDLSKKGSQAKSKKFSSKIKRQEEEAKEELIAEEKLMQHRVRAQKFELPAEPVVREVKVGELIVVADLANQLALKSSVVIMQLMKMGVMATVNQTIDQDTAILLIEELGHKYILVKDEEEELQQLVDNNVCPKVARAPIVTVMGHVDHGKTTLLDAIRKTRLVDGEAGGITQSIGAYSVETNKGSITFLDTPGHEAFTAMRARGAQCTDIVILIVAADDGVMPQTIEAIQHAKAAKVPIVVAVNKIDKEDADVEKIKGELAQYDVVAESWGGDVLFQEVSAKKGIGIDDLLDNLVLQADLLDLTAASEGAASGLVIEAVLDKGFGAMATLLVQSGCLSVGDIVLIGSEYGKVRSMVDSYNQKVTTAGPCIPVKVTGLSGVPVAGEAFMVMESEKVAREYSLIRKSKQRDKRISQVKVKPLDQMFADAAKSEDSEVVSIVLKADTHGSAEALAESVKQLSTEKIAIKVIASGVGMINESDVNLAYASNAVLVGFNVRADVAANKLIQAKSIEPFYCQIIYDLIEHVKAAIKGLEAPEFIEKVIGKVDVRDFFRSSKFGTVAGCMVVDGLVKRNALVRVIRDGIVIHQGQINSLRREKDDVAEVKLGVECGIGIKDYTDVKVGDQFEIFISKQSD